MNLVTEPRLAEITRIEHLLYGTNYEVWVNIYGPLDTELGLDLSLQAAVSKTAKASDITLSDPDEAASQIRGLLLYEGDIGHGPESLEAKRDELESLLTSLFERIGLKEADLVVGFEFRKGHPAYPVFWDFAYDIHSEGKRWILVGCASD